MRRLLLFLLPVLACAQTAKFPAEVVTDSHLGVVRNRVQSVSIAQMNVSDNVLIVQNGAGFVPNMAVTVDDRSGTTEIVWVCAANGNILQIGLPGSCPSTNGRGFDGTTPLSHAAGAIVSAFIDAWHHNALSAEVKALETALGAGMANVAASGVNSDISELAGLTTPLSIASGGTNAASAAAARANLGAVAPADGVTWTGAHTFSGGSVNYTAAGKTAPIRIGASNPATCDATVRERFYNTTTNKEKVCNSTNVWSDTSANSDEWFDVKTFGAVCDGATDDAASIQAAIDAAVAAHGTVLVPPSLVCRSGSLTINGSGVTFLLGGSEIDLTAGSTITMTGARVTIASIGRSTIKALGTGGDVIKVSACANCSIRDIDIDRVGTAVAGGNGIRFAAGGANNNFYGDSITIMHQYRGLYAEVLMQVSSWKTLHVENSVLYGIDLQETNGETFYDTIVIYSGSHGIRVGGGNWVVGQTSFLGLSTYLNGGDGLHIEGANSTTQSVIYTFIDDALMDTNGGNGIYSKNTVGVYVANTLAANNTLNGIMLDSGTYGAQFAGVNCGGNHVDGIYLNGASGVTISGTVTTNNGPGAGTSYGLRLANYANNVNISGLTTGNIATTNQYGGIIVDASVGSPTNVSAVGVAYVQLSANKLTKTGTIDPSVWLFIPGTYSAPTLLNSWVNTGSFHQTAGYYQIDGTVKLTGTITGGTYVDATSILQLPVGYRPPLAVRFAVHCNDGVNYKTCTLQVDSGGNVKLYGATGNQSLALDGVSFRAN